jgi:hypothetical protein
MAAVGCLDKGRTPSAGIVACRFALHLDDIGAEVGKDLARPGSRQDAGKLEHT